MKCIDDKTSKCISDLEFDIELLKSALQKIEADLLSYKDGKPPKNGSLVDIMCEKDRIKKSLAEKECELHELQERRHSDSSNSEFRLRVRELALTNGGVKIRAIGNTTLRTIEHKKDKLKEILDKKLCHSK
jgi:hypothetical protein